MSKGFCILKPAICERLKIYSVKVFSKNGLTCKQNLTHLSISPATSLWLRQFLDFHYFHQTPDHHLRFALQIHDACASFQSHEWFEIDRFGFEGAGALQTEHEAGLLWLETGVGFSLSQKVGMRRGCR